MEARSLKRNCSWLTNSTPASLPLESFRQRKNGNMDQTPSPFDLNSGKTYADKGSKTVWCRLVGGSGLDKRQATVQLIIFGDGMPRTKPLVIFRGTGQHITQAEKPDYDHRVTVKFHPNVGCDETMFLFWAGTCGHGIWSRLRCWFPTAIGLR